MKITLVVLILGAVVLQGCGTVNGFGRDTENVGQWMQKSSQKHVDNMELKRWRSAVEEQNRLHKRSQQLSLK